MSTTELVNIVFVPMMIVFLVVGTFMLSELGVRVINHLTDKNKKR